MAIYQLENYIQSSMKTPKEIEIENDEEVKELGNNYVRLFKVHSLYYLKHLKNIFYFLSSTNTSMKILNSWISRLFL